MRQMARLTEALRIAVHDLALALRDRSPSLSADKRRAEAFEQFEQVEQFWFHAWSDVRPELDRYIDANIVLDIRSLRHDTKATVDDLLTSVLAMQSGRLPASRNVGHPGHPHDHDPAPEALHRALGLLDELLHHLNAIRIICEKGGVGSNRAW